MRSRSDGIRTHDLCVPNAALYQTEPRFDFICFLNSRPSTIAIIYDVYRNVNTFFEIFLIFFIIASKGTFYTGLRPFWCSFRMTVSEKVKKRDMPEVLFRHISYLCFSADIHLHTARRSSAPRNGCCRRCLRGRKRFRGLLPCKSGR